MTIRVLPEEARSHGEPHPDNIAILDVIPVRGVSRRRQSVHPLTLLDLALAHQTKQQWSSADRVVLFESKGTASLRPYRVYLSTCGPDGCMVAMYITGYGPGLNVFMLNPEIGWVVVPGLNYKYRAWAQRARKWYVRAQRTAPPQRCAPTAPPHRRKL